ncbi:hypothetical protein A6770_08275 [Nostoc minutum NIES-26]|uniref:Uncharacterized protein n=1 Tax=Nostoc minutum NIES-26 TaxID=1844469 RepID=A0A367S061_9NOSO|nr:hypothetical protein A6770_08275 [Nostoc minutum NIES-26]
MARKKGNPDIKKYGFSTERDEPLTERFNIRVTQSMMAKLKALESPADFARQAIQKALDELDILESSEE